MIMIVERTKGRELIVLLNAYKNEPFGKTLVKFDHEPFETYEYGSLEDNLDDIMVFKKSESIISRLAQIDTIYIAVDYLSQPDQVFMFPI